jgi:hypothetical protein
MREIKNDSNNQDAIEQNQNGAAELAPWNHQGHLASLSSEILNFGSAVRLGFQAFAETSQSAIHQARSVSFNRHSEALIKPQLPKVFTSSIKVIQAKTRLPKAKQASKKNAQSSLDYKASLSQRRERSRGNWQSPFSCQHYRSSRLASCGYSLKLSLTII